MTTTEFLKKLSSISISVWYLIPFVLLAYFIGFFFKTFRLNKIRKAIINNSLIIAIVIFIVGFFITDIGLQQAFYIFSSIYFGFWLSKQETRGEERRKERFYLGLVWNELRFNRNKLEEIKVNFHFDFHIIIQQFAPALYIRYNKIFTSTKLLEKEAYSAFKASGNIVMISSDDVFNAIEIAYANIKIAQSVMDTINQNLQTFSMSFPTMSMPPTELERKIIDDSKEYISTVAREIAMAYRAVILAIDIIDKHLNGLDVKMNEEELRESLLNDEDNEFISKSNSWRNPSSPPNGITYTEI